MLAVAGPTNKVRAVQVITLILMILILMMMNTLQVQHSDENELFRVSDIDEDDGLME